MKKYLIGRKDDIMIKPPALQKGDTIGIFSPSYPASSILPERNKLAIEFLEAKGYRVLCGDLTEKRDNYRSGSIKQRVNELNSLIQNNDVKCIMAVSGGMVSNSLLPYINYDYLEKYPKIIIGYSDVTAILLAVYSMTKLVTFYGPNLFPVFGEVAPFSEMSYRYFNDLLSSKVQYPYKFPTPEIWTDDSVGLEEIGVTCKKHKNKLVTLNNGKASGRLVCGNLNTMEGFFGSKYMPQIQEGNILMIEDGKKDAETIERSYSMLKVSGVFDKIGGLIVGKHTDFDDRGSNKKDYDILMEIIGDVSFPILAEFDCSHTKPMLTMPIGCNVELNATDKKVTLLEKCVM